MEGNLRFKIDWTSLIVGRKFTVFALFYFVFEGNFQVQAPGGLYLEGRFNGRFFGLKDWGAYIWRGLSSEFYGSKMMQIYSGFRPYSSQLHRLPHHACSSTTQKKNTKLMAVYYLAGTGKKYCDKCFCPPPPQDPCHYIHHY